MARPLRLEFPGALYHLTARGNAQQAIFFLVTRTGSGSDEYKGSDPLSVSCASLSMWSMAG